MELMKGMRDKLTKYVDTGRTVEVNIGIAGRDVYDFCCFGVDAQGKLSDDRYMVFYNQTSSPNREIVYAPVSGGAVFTVNLSALPASVQKLVFTVSIDGNSTMGDISAHTVTIGNAGQPALKASLPGSDFAREKAMISIEIYRKDEWRFNMVASGFNGGIADLLHHFGGVESSASSQPAPQPVPVSRPVPQPVPVSRPVPPVSQPAPQPVPVSRPVPPVSQPVPPPVQNNVPAQGRRVSLEKKLEKAPELVSLAKPIMVQLEKKNLTDCVARVALVMDISGSMTTSYKNGTVQEIINKILPLAVQFDDDGELDLWYYGSTCKKCKAVNLKNYKKAVPSDWKNLMKKLGYCNNEPEVMKDVMHEFKRSKLPAYVIFVTDGGVSQAKKIENLLKEASEMPIFWQFVGVSGSGYGILKELDDLRGRYVDNANFFALDDFRSVSNEELYERLLNEFPVWLKEVRRLGMIRA